LNEDTLRKLSQGVKALQEGLTCHYCHNIIARSKATTPNCPHHLCKDCSIQQLAKEGK